ncbi:MAG: hypothetical protein HWE10_14410 [Gammaproteobacteria bacterium]|nr:hypothetical protein [Gammaproteobacteria bacterium]
MLLASLGSALLTVLLMSERLIFTRMSYSLGVLTLLLLYFLLNLLWDSQSIAQIKEVTIGTSGGVIFSLLTGIIAAIAMAGWHKVYSCAPFMLKLTKPFVLFLFLVAFGLILRTFQEAIGNVRSDLFLVQDQSGLYQRPGKIMLMLYILLCTIFATLQSYLRTHRLWGLTSLFLLTAIAMVLMAQAQLIGSNSGLITVTFTMLIVWSHWLLIGTSAFSLLKRHVKLKHVFMSWITRKLVAYGVTLIGLVALLLAWLLDKMNIDIYQFRIFGFGSGNVSSVDSRLTLLKNNFLTQWAHSPIWGHTQVDSLTTGKGTYAHSLISLLTHLGLVGALLFVLLIVFIYRDIYSSLTVRKTFYHHKQFALFRLLVLTIILLFAVLTTFYTWMPLWFSIGLLGVTLVFKDTKV